MVLASVNICSPKSSAKSCRANGSNSTIWEYPLSNRSAMALLLISFNFVSKIEVGSLILAE
eukprot:8290713-Ditylum_brightwellii.AAC.1